MDSRKALHRGGKVACAAAGIFLFILGLYTIKEGAGVFRPLLQSMGVQGIPGLLGFGWLMACLVLSGSPVAATALAFHADSDPAQRLDVQETFAMITGSRMGAAFVVLFTGFIYDLRGKKHQKSVYVGALALLTTLTTYIPAMALGYGILEMGWLDHVRFQPVWIDVVDRIFDPLVALAKGFLGSQGRLLMVPLGVGVLLLAFKVFDKALPDVDPTHGWVARMATVVYRPAFTFLVGMLITSITLSVSVSVSILVPLTAKGYVRRENLIPYILGANITTFIDTLVGSLLIASPHGFTIVLVEMISVALVSLPIVLLLYGPYERFIDRMAHAATADRKRLALFVSFFLAAPLVLVLISFLP